MSTKKLTLEDLIPVKVQRARIIKDASVSINSNGLYLNKTFCEENRLPSSGFAVVLEHPNDESFFFGIYTKLDDIPIGWRQGGNVISFERKKKKDDKIEKEGITVSTVWPAKRYGIQMNIIHELRNIDGRAFYECLPEDRRTSKQKEVYRQTYGKTN